MKKVLGKNFLEKFFMILLLGMVLGMVGFWPLGAYGSPPPFQITTTSLPTGQVSSAYRGTLTAMGGVPPYTWSIISGTLPAGLNLGTATGIISGTPTTVGIFTFTTLVSDQAGSSTSKELSIYVEVQEVIVYNSSGEIIGTYTTIQQGVNACPVGGTVSVSGTYDDTVYITKRIALEGVGLPTIHPFVGTAVIFSDNGADGASISGFRINAGWNGHGIFCDNGADPFITNNTISGNSEVGYNGIYCNDDSSPRIINNVIVNNGRGILIWNSFAAYIYNNTIHYNVVDGIYCGPSSSFDSGGSQYIRNNIITRNYNGYGIKVGIYSPYWTLKNDYNNVYRNSRGNYYNCSAGSNDISSDPQFIGDDDYRLNSSSLCIDAGSNINAFLLPTDKDGKLRIIDGDSNGIATVDMGAYEFQVHGMAVQIGFILSTNTITADGTITCTLFGTDSNGVCWDASPEAIFSTTDPKGSITANVYNPGRVGTWTITAKLLGKTGTLTAIATVTVLHGQAIIIAIAPQNVSTYVNVLTNYFSLGTDTDGNSWDLTSLSTFTTTGGGSFTNNVFKATSSGTFTIFASYLNLIATTTIYIEPHGLATQISLILSTNTITADGTITCTLYGTDSNGISWDATSEATFSTTDPKGSFTNNIYNPVKVGTWIITAQLLGKDGTLTQIVTVTVIHGIPTSLIISPANITLTADQSQQYKGNYS